MSLGIAGLREARALGVPAVASYHTDVPGLGARSGLGILGRPVWSYLQWVHDQADLTLCPSPTTKRQLDSRGFQRLTNWTHGVDSKRFSPAHRSPAWRDRLSNGTPDAPLLLYVGRLSAEKGLDRLTALTDELPAARVAIVGDGPSRASLERRFAGKPVVFAGHLTGQDLACAYASSDLFVVPGANETLASVVLEAMASGLPIVAPRTGGVLDLVVDGKNGLLFETDSSRSMVRRVRRLLIDLQLASEMARAARAMAEERSWARVLDRLLDDYWRLLGGGQPGTIPLLIPRSRLLARDTSPASE